MRSKVGSILLLIGGIITLLIIVSFSLTFFRTMYLESVNEGPFPVSVWPISTQFYIPVLVVLVLGMVLKFWASKLMKDPMKTKKGGIVAIIASAITGFELLSLIGGIVALIDSGKT